MDTHDARDWEANLLNKVGIVSRDACPHIVPLCGLRYLYPESNSHATTRNGSNWLAIFVSDVSNKHILKTYKGKASIINEDCFLIAQKTND